jgi:TRAP-type mannitol/chloroaromatic compound transport system permease small subunit
MNDKEMTNKTPSTPDSVREQIEENARRLDAIYESVEKTRKYFMASMIISIVVFVLPLIAAVILIPMFLDSYLGQFQGLL